jgi:sugar phosphate isomerase/epimerase
MSLSINTDIVPGSGPPFPLINKIAEKGFEFIEWNRHWYTDYLYSNSEIEEIKNRIKEYNIKLNSLHASIGIEKQWFSENDYQRKEGAKLVKNRIEMTAELGGDVIILHPFKTLDPELYNIHFKQGLKSLKDLKEVVKIQELKTLSKTLQC